MSTATTTVLETMVKEIKNGAATAAQDLSKGVVPIILVLALIGPAYWLGTKVEAVRQEQTSAAASMQDIEDKLDSLTPLVQQVATLQAKIESHERALELSERDDALLDSRLRQVEKKLEVELELRKRN